MQLEQRIERTSAPGSADNVRLLYLASHGFSGSTLLASLLGSHPEIATVGEVTGLARPAEWPTYRCSCGTLVQECDFWRTLTRELRAVGSDYQPYDARLSFNVGDSWLTMRLLSRSLHFEALDRIRDRILFKVPQWSERHARVLANNVLFFRMVLALTERRIFFDATKDPQRIVHLRRDPRVDMKVVHLTRDPRGVAYSTRKNKGQRPEIGALTWRLAHSQIERLLTTVPVNEQIWVRYEDLCAETEAVLQRIAAFCGAEPFRKVDLTANTQHIMGNRMRIRSDRKIRLDEAWREGLTAEEVGRVTRIAGRLGTKYGYL